MCLLKLKKSCLCDKYVIVVRIALQWKKKRYNNNFNVLVINTQLMEVLRYLERRTNVRLVVSKNLFNSYIMMSHRFIIISMIIITINMEAECLYYGNYANKYLGKFE
jgi:hypothetical protein